jgi:hypothetical protein
MFYCAQQNETCKLNSQGSKLRLANQTRQLNIWRLASCHIQNPFMSSTLYVSLPMVLLLGYLQMVFNAHSERHELPRGKDMELLTTPYYIASLVYIYLRASNLIRIMTRGPLWFQIISDYICFLFYLTTLFVIIKWHSLDSMCMKFEYGTFWSDNVREKPKYWDIHSVQLPVYSAQVLHGLACDWTRVPALERPHLSDPRQIPFLCKNNNYYTQE